MFKKAVLVKAKKAVPIATAILLVFISGCSLWPFGKTDSAEKALRLRNQADQKYNLIKAHAKKFDAFLVDLHKRWYTTKDVQRFVNELGNFKNEIAADQASLKQIDADLIKLGQLDKKGKFKRFSAEMSNSSKSLEKALTSSQGMVNALNPKISNIAKLYRSIDDVKQTQSIYAAALVADAEREQQSAYSRALLQSLLAPPPADNTDNPSSEIPSGSDSTDSLTETPQPINTAETTTDTGSTDSTSSSSDIPPWVYSILPNTWPSSYTKDYVQESSEKFNNIYQDVYLLHKGVNFVNSKKLVNYLQQVKADNADFAASLVGLYENIKEQKALEKQIKDVESTLAFLNASKNSYAYLKNNRPAGVSDDSVASKGMGYGRKISEDEINRYKDKQRNLNDRLDTLKQAAEGSLTSDYNETSWRFRGSLIALYQLNIGISRDLMHETKRWKSNAIAKFAYQRLEYLAEAKHHNFKANQAYTEASNKIASK